MVKIGFKHTKESRKKMSINHSGGPRKNHVVTKNTRIKISKTKKDLFKKGIIKLNKSNWKKGHTPWNKGLKYKNTKYDYMCENAIQNGINTTIKLAKSKISKAELKLKEYLKKNKIKFIHQYPYKLGVADFYIHKQNLIIQCYGTYWHSKPDYIKRDKKQQKWLKNNGYNILILCSEDIMKCSKINEIFDITLLKGGKI